MAKIIKAHATINSWDEQEPEIPRTTNEGSSPTGEQDSETNPPVGEVTDTEFDGNVILSTNIYSVSAAEAGALSKALTTGDAGDQTLNSYIQTNGDISTDVIANNSDAEIFAVKAENAAAGDNYYVLDVDAKAAEGFNINSYDISLGYDKDRFEVLDVGINGSFNFFNSAELDAENGSVRVVGGSAGNLAEGVGSGTADGNTFQLLLKQYTMTLTTAKRQ